MNKQLSISDIADLIRQVSEETAPEILKALDLGKVKFSIDISAYNPVEVELIYKTKVKITQASPDSEHVANNVLTLDKRMILYAKSIRSNFYDNKIDKLYPEEDVYTAMRDFIRILVIRKLYMMKYVMQSSPVVVDNKYIWFSVQENFRNEFRLSASVQDTFFEECFLKVKSECDCMLHSMYNNADMSIILDVYYLVCKFKSEKG